MKILYVCTSTERGGAEKALQALVLAARAAGHQVRVLSLRPAGAVARALQKEGIDTLSFEVTDKSSPVQAAGALARLVKEIQTFQPDIVHGFLYRAIQLCRQAKKYANFKLVTTPHYDLSKKNYFLRLWDRSLKNADDASCAESQQTADFLREKQKYPKVYLICNGVNSAYFIPDAQARANERKKLGFLPENTVFCCVARLAKEKNQEILLHAFAFVHAKNPSVRLLFVGDGAEQKRLLHLIRQNNLEKEVVWVGEVPDVKPYLQAADVFVLPSKTESLPLALLEACACELPAIVSKAGDMPQVVRHGETGFVFNGTDAVLLSALMAELVENTALRQKMGQNARTRMIKKYPPAESKYLELYTKIK